MNKKILKILIATLILFVGLGAVCATQSNTTDDIISAQPDDAIAISENNDEALAIENETSNVLEANSEVDELSAAENETQDVLEANNNISDVLTVENDPQKVEAPVNNTVEVLSAEVNQETKLAVASSDDVLTASIHYKTVTLAKMKFPKKYIHTDYKNLPKKWKKIYDKREKKFMKTYTKNLKKLKKKNWKPVSDPFTKVKYKGKTAIIYVKLKCYKYY